MSPGSLTDQLAPDLEIVDVFSRVRVDLFRAVSIQELDSPLEISLPDLRRSGGGGGYPSLTLMPSSVLVEFRVSSNDLLIVIQPLVRHYSSQFPLSHAFTLSQNSVTEKDEMSCSLFEFET